MGKRGLHTSFSQHLFNLPSKFRILITSRPNGLGPAFTNALSLHTLCHKSTGWVTMQMMRRLFFISPLPSSRLVHCCLDSRGVSSYFLGRMYLHYYCGLLLRPYYNGLLLLTDSYRVAWPWMAWTRANTYAPLCHTPVPAPTARLPSDLSAFSSCLITVQRLCSPLL
jgi:hypothetical protein